MMAFVCLVFEAHSRVDTLNVAPRGTTRPWQLCFPLEQVLLNSVASINLCSHHFTFETLLSDLTSLKIPYLLKLQFKRKRHRPESQKWKARAKMLEKILLCLYTTRMCHYSFVSFGTVSTRWWHTPMVGIVLPLVSTRINRSLDRECRGLVETRKPYIDWVFNITHIVPHLLTKFVLHFTMPMPLFSLG